MGFGTCGFFFIHLVWPQEFGISIVFNFSWDDCITRQKLEANFMQIVLGETRSNIGDVEMINEVFQRCNTDKKYLVFPEFLMFRIKTRVFVQVFIHECILKVDIAYVIKLIMLNRSSPGAG